MLRDCKPIVSGWPLKAVAALLVTAACAHVHAAENGLQRYSPGIGGSDMTSPLTPGWYVQFPLVAYHASKLMGDDGKQATTDLTPVAVAKGYPGLAGVRAPTTIEADTYALLPRLTYLSTTRFLGANVGLTAMLPLVKTRASFGLTAPAGYALYQPVLDGVAQSLYGSQTGIGDAEVAPILHWEIGDHQAVSMAATVILPTGDYTPGSRVNPGFGNYFTFRPSVQYAFIGDGWDFGARTVLSFNTRNKADGYYSGNMFNMDWQLMKFVSDDVRAGLQGYFVRQLSKDTQDLTGFTQQQQLLLGQQIINGNKSSVNAIGPAVGWLRNGGDFLLEGKFLKEFDARNRMEGQAVWLTLSKPL